MVFVLCCSLCSWLSPKRHSGCRPPDLQWVVESCIQASKPGKQNCLVYKQMYSPYHICQIIYFMMKSLRMYGYCTVYVDLNIYVRFLWRSSHTRHRCLVHRGLRLPASDGLQLQLGAPKRLIALVFQTSLSWIALYMKSMERKPFRRPFRKATELKTANLRSMQFLEFVLGMIWVAGFRNFPVMVTAGPSCGSNLKISQEMAEKWGPHPIEELVTCAHSNSKAMEMFLPVLACRGDSSPGTVHCIFFLLCLKVGCLEIPCCQMLRIK